MSQPTISFINPIAVISNGIFYGDKLYFCYMLWIIIGILLFILCSPFTEDDNDVL